MSVEDARALRSTGAPLLSVSHLRKAFGGVVAVDDVSFDVAAGERLALIGPNGAGKTTCFNLINGQLAADRGSVRLRTSQGAVRLDGLPPHRIAAQGVARTFQTAATFASMSVRENVQIALLCHAGGQWSLLPGALRAYAAAAGALLARCSAGALADRPCGQLAYADLKRVEIAIALAASPRLLLMDEPTAGTAPADRVTVMQFVSAIARTDGVAVVFTEHDVDVVFAYADRIIVLDRGRIIAEGPPEAIRADARVQKVYFGVEGE
ncbi:MAG: ABC transporter ATP-binding protein [Betaproteobacteria bacterium]